MKTLKNPWVVAALILAGCVICWWLNQDGDHYTISHYHGVVYRANDRTGKKQYSTPDGWKDVP